MIVLHQIDPIALKLGPVSVHWYGVMYLIAFGLAWWLGVRRIRAGRLPGVSEQGFGDLLFWGMVGVVIGGRLGSMFFYSFDALLRDPLMILRIWEGGMSFHGGLLGVMAACWLWARKHGLAFFDVMDFIAPLVPTGLGFGRLGNYIGGELWGKYTASDWGVVFPRAETFGGQPIDAIRAQFATGALDVFARHPSQLYQAFLEGVVLFAAVWIYSRKPRPRYAVGGVFALVYGLGRFLVEFVREPDADLGYIAYGWLTMGQLLSLPLIALGLILLACSRRAPVLMPLR